MQDEENKNATRRLHIYLHRLGLGLGLGLEFKQWNKTRCDQDKHENLQALFFYERKNILDDNTWNIAAARWRQGQRQDKTRQDKTRQHKARQQNTTRHNTKERRQCELSEDKTRQDTTRVAKIRQVKARQENTRRRQDKTRHKTRPLRSKAVKVILGQWMSSY